MSSNRGGKYHGGWAPAPNFDSPFSSSSSGSGSGPSTSSPAQHFIHSGGRGQSGFAQKRNGNFYQNEQPPPNHYQQHQRQWRGGNNSGNRGAHRGNYFNNRRGRGGRGNSRQNQQQNDKNIDIKEYFMPQMCSDPWKTLIEQYEQEYGVKVDK